MNRIRLDQGLVRRRLVKTRSQAESYIKLGKVTVNGQVITKPGSLIGVSAEIKLNASEQYVSRAGLKLASVSQALKLDFRGKVILDVGSSTGGFTDYALRHGAQKVIAVDVGTNQLHPSLRNDPRIELHEQTDIRDFRLKNVDYRIDAKNSKIHNPDSIIDLILIDVSFISLRDILPSIYALCNKSDTVVVAMAKPQFEAGAAAKHKGVIKNDKMRRDTLKELETWIKNLFKIIDKADSNVAGAKGNQERFYLLKKLVS